MYVSVVYYNDKSKGFSGRTYTYSTNLDLKVGDKVMCPISGDTKKRALVVDVDLPTTAIDDSWRDRIKDICEYDYTNMTEVL